MTENLSPRERRLKNDYLALDKLRRTCLRVRIQRESKPRFDFHPNGNIEAGEYPDEYMAILRVQGIKSLPLVSQKEHQFRIQLHPGYPIEPPRIIWQTPIFHPNISTFDKTDETFQYLLDELGNEDLVYRQVSEDPELAKSVEGYVCLDALQENWTPFFSLDKLVVELANMVRYKTYNTKSVLNKAAGDWAKIREKLSGEFPLGDGLLEIQNAEIEINL